MPSDDAVLVAIVGRSVGLKGEFKLNLKTDFPSQFKNGYCINIDGEEFRVEYFKKDSSVVKLIGLDCIDDIKRLINKRVFCTKDVSRETIKLKEGQFFYFDIIGLSINEGGVILGVVENIDRVATTDYFYVKTHNNLSYIAKTFLIPYVENYVKDVDIKGGVIHTKNAYDILINS